ncbi:MAG: hypothetical protein M1401_08805 [Chloroflexi bacterium]|nr:hypothetical protein [Chloroflexota bacterium]
MLEPKHIHVKRRRGNDGSRLTRRLRSQALRPLRAMLALRSALRERIG